MFLAGARGMDSNFRVARNFAVVNCAFVDFQRVTGSLALGVTAGATKMGATILQPKVKGKVYSAIVHI